MGELAVSSILVFADLSGFEFCGNYLLTLEVYALRRINFFNFSKLHVKMFQILVHTNNQITGETVLEVRNCDFTSIQILFILLKIF